MEVPKLNKQPLLTLATASAALVYKLFWATDDITLPQVAGVVAATLFLVVVLGQVSLRMTRKMTTIFIAAIVVIVGIIVTFAVINNSRSEVPVPAIPSGNLIPLEQFLKEQDTRQKEVRP